MKQGWKWTEAGWVFDPNIHGQDCDIRYTCNEFCKNFNAVMDFLEFTTESEIDFETGFLPTLDTQTRVLDCGSILYKFFSKPMKNNLVVENGTSLPRNIVFGSLRQEVIRRLQNTSQNIDQQTKIYLIEELIQLMVNSNHQYAFIKSVILQGITKFKYMEWRAALPCTDPRYMPMHRPFEFKRGERILTKYAESTTWFKNDKLGDPFKDGWRAKIKFNWARSTMKLKENT